MKIREGFKLRKIGNEHIVTGEGLQQINFNKLISLNSSAAYLWREVEKREFDILMIAGLLSDKYGIGTGQALSDAADVVNSWIKAEIAEE